MPETRICGEMDKYTGRASIVKIQITNKIIYKMHRSYAVLYTQGTPTSAANVSALEGIEVKTCSTPYIPAQSIIP